ncbi:MAG: hypothetical protein IT450_00070 [Phycisphaerales bacterium]|nr:hypothetical protein [Phycisphaerales bacterium]
MATFPTSPRAAFIQWCQTHAPIFSANAAAIGLTPAQATAFTTATDTAATDVQAQDAAKQAAKVATQEANGSVGSLQTMAGDLVRVIRAFAQTQTKPDVIYNTAQIPPPAQPSPTPPPGSPTEFRIELLQTGPLKLTWKCPNPPGIGGTTYEIMRRVGAGAFTYVGTTGSREFLDETLPAGSASATYQITATRSTSRGVPAQFTVNLGVTPVGATYIAGVEGDAHVMDASRAAAPANTSTVNGRAVQKVLPSNGQAKTRSR